MENKQKLELTWYGKTSKMNIEPRILIENQELSFFKDNDNDLFDLQISESKKSNDNLLIHGDNLLALKALEQSFSGKIKCIYIDPPYNTGSAFETYDDNLQHSTWLSLMKPRLKLLRTLLSKDGFIFVQIDDNEHAYLKILMDEIFGRSNYLTSFIWIGRSGQGGTAKNIANQHEYILCYSKSSEAVLNKENRKTTGGNYKDEVGYYKREQLRQWGQADKRSDRPSMWYSIAGPDGTPIYPIKDDGTEGRWRVSKQTYNKLKNNNLLDFVKIEKGWKVYKKIRDGRITQRTYGTLLDDFGSSATGTSEIKKIFSAKTFDTPKPEKLLERIITMATNPGDFVLDSFLGSGTTTAVAHKMNRKWIGIELGEHAYSHCKVRMDKVIKGEQGGISKNVNWQGGGGYKFYELAPTLIKEDSFGQTIINPEYNAEMLATAVAKHEGYKYNPDAVNFWKQSTNDSKSYLFVTTKHITKEYLLSISSEMQDDEYLVIVCKSYDSNIQYEFKNIEIKKIPQSLLNNCEYDVDNYNLNIIHPPVYDEEEDLDD